MYAIEVGPVRLAAHRLDHVPVDVDAVPADADGGEAVEQIVAGEVDLLVRIFSMGPLHHAMTGTGAVAIAVAAAIPGTLVHEVARVNAGGRVCFGHPSGTLTAGADAQIDAAGNWVIRQVSMSRSARRLMDGQVFIPAV